MEINPTSFHMNPALAEINEKCPLYARVLDKGNQLTMQSQKAAKDDGMFRTHSFEKFQGLAHVESTPIGGNLFISGSSAPVCGLKERKVGQKKQYRGILNVEMNKF